jgi:WD40 repeat protein
MPARGLALEGRNGQVLGMCFRLNGMRLASAGHDKTVEVWDSASGQDILNLKGHTNIVAGLCFSPNGTQLASASADGTVRSPDRLAPSGSASCDLFARP